jgi:hypothetical protein
MPGTGRRTRPSGCSITRPGTPSRRWPWCAGSRWPGWRRQRAAAARQWIPREHIEDPVKSLLMGLPLDLAFRTKGQLAIDISNAAAADGIRPDFYCGDEVYGNCTELREHFEAGCQAYVLRVPSNFTLTLAAGTKLTCVEAVKSLLKRKTALGGPLRRERIQGRALVCPGMDRHRLPAPSPAGPPPPQDRRTCLPLLLRP